MAYSAWFGDCLRRPFAAPWLACGALSFGSPSQGAATSGEAVAWL